MNIFLIGMGNMGLKHLDSLMKLKNKYSLNFIGYFDPSIKNIKYKNKIFYSEKKINAKTIEEKKIDLCIISTPHNLTIKYFKIINKTNRNINLFIEKPFGLNLSEAKYMMKNKKRSQKIFLGLNYRYYSGIKKLHDDFINSDWGKINSINLSMAHGHSPAIKKSWKIKKSMAGGGVIIDPGIHIINLLKFFIKEKIEIRKVITIKNYFWKTGIEEVALIILKTKKIPIINVNLSIVKWRSEFKIEINGEKKYAALSGRGSHYGPQVYRQGQRWGWLKSKNKNQFKTEKILSKSDEKNSFIDEFESIIKVIKKKHVKINPCQSAEAFETMSLIEKIYQYAEK